MQKAQSNTVGDGNCFFHALLGEKNSNGQFEDKEHLLHRTQLITYAQDKLGKIIDNYENEPYENLRSLEAFAIRFEENIENILLDTFDKNALKNRINQKIQNEFGNNGRWIEIGLLNSFVSDCFKKNFIILIPDAEHTVEGSYGSGDTTIINFVNGNHFERVEQTQHISNPDDKNYTLRASPINQRPLLIDLALRGNYDALKDVVNCDPNVTDTIFKKNTPLIWAIANGNNEFASKFIETFGDKIDFLKQAIDNNALFLILTKGYKDKTSGGTTFNEQYSALNIAKKSKETIGNERFKELINQKCRLGNTALHIACARHDTETINFLIESGADIKSQNEHRFTPFDMLDLDYKDACNLCNNISSAFLLEKTLYDSFDKKQIKVLQQQNTNSKPDLSKFNIKVISLNKDRDEKIKQITGRKIEIKPVPIYKQKGGDVNRIIEYPVKKSITKKKTEITPAPITPTRNNPIKKIYQVSQNKKNNYRYTPVDTVSEYKPVYEPVYQNINNGIINRQPSVVNSSINTQTNNGAEDDKKHASQANLYIDPLKSLKDKYSNINIISRFFTFIGSIFSSQIAQKRYIIKQLQTIDLTIKDNNYNADKTNYDLLNRALKCGMVSEIPREPNVSDVAYKTEKTNNNNPCCNIESKNIDNHVNRRRQNIELSY
jgi:ankyrin repeat protein